MLMYVHADVTTEYPTDSTDSTRQATINQYIIIGATGGSISVLLVLIALIIILIVVLYNCRDHSRVSKAKKKREEFIMT